MAAFVRFPSTIWTTISNSPERARSRVFSAYRVPIFNYILNQGFSEHDAEDISQEVFIRVCKEEFLRRVDRSKGTFRSLLLAVTRHVIDYERQRRRKGRAVSVEQGGFDGGRIDIPAEVKSDKGFDDLWVKNLTRLGLQRLQEECSSGGPKYYDALVLSKLQGLGYAQIADKLGSRVTDITNWVHHAKKKFKVYVLEAVRAYSSSEAEYKAELALINRFLR